MPLSEYRLILFDVDETLLDFKAAEEHALGLCWNRYFKEAIALENFASEFRAINLRVWHDVEKGKLKLPRVSYERARRILKHFGLRTGIAEELGQLYALGLSAVAQWLPNAEDGFRNIATRYKVGLITNGLSSIQHPRIDRLGIRSMLSCVQVSEDAGTSKPRPELFNRALDQAGVKKEHTLMVGDSVSSDFQGALNAEMDFCWVAQNAQSLSFEFPKPNFQVESIRELDEILN